MRITAPSRRHVPGRCSAALPAAGMSVQAAIIIHQPVVQLARPEVRIGLRRLPVAQAVGRQIHEQVAQRIQRVREDLVVGVVDLGLRAMRP